LAAYDKSDVAIPHGGRAWKKNADAKSEEVYLRATRLVLPIFAQVGQRCARPVDLLPPNSQCKEWGI
jgi:hypothetical protein